MRSIYPRPWAPQDYSGLLPLLRFSLCARSLSALFSLFARSLFLSLLIEYEILFLFACTFFAVSENDEWCWHVPMFTFWRCIAQRSDLSRANCIRNMEKWIKNLQMQSSKATNKSGTQDIDICVHTVNQLEKGYCLTSLFDALVKHPISIFGGPNEKKKSKNHYRMLWKTHTSFNQSIHRDRERWRNSISCKCSTEQHSTALHKVSARKLLFALPQANPWTQLTTVYHWCNNTAYILYISLADGFWYRFCFLCNKFQGITWIRRNWFHFRNLYLWTKKTQTTVWIHCIAKQSISLYSVGTVTIKTFRIPFWRTCK